MLPQPIMQQPRPRRRRRRGAVALLLALAAAGVSLSAPVAAAPAARPAPHDSHGSHTARALLEKQAECGTHPIPSLTLDDPAAIVTLDVAPEPADGTDAPKGALQHYRQYQVVYKTEVVIREFPEHFMYSLGAFDPDQSNETVQVFRGGEPYLKNEDCPGPSRATVEYKCREDAPVGQERLVEAVEASPGSCDFRLTVETRRVCMRPSDEL